VAGPLELLIGLDVPAAGVPVAMVAAGGVREAILADRALDSVSLAPTAAADMVARLRCSRLIDGYRGSAGLDRVGVVRVLERISLLATIAPQIRGLDVNPLVVGPNGVVALDVKVRVAGAEDPRPTGIRWTTWSVPWADQQRAAKGPGRGHRPGPLWLSPVLRRNHSGGSSFSWTTRTGQSPRSAHEALTEPSVVAQPWP
jgi:hypothetical protein